MNIAATDLAADAGALHKASGGALIIGGALGAVAVARSLGRRGIPVCFLVHDHPIGKFSRHVSLSLPWSGPDGAQAVEKLLALVRAHRMEGWTLFACGDAEARFIAENEGRLSAVLVLTTPSWDVLRWAYDKHLTYQRAAEVGVATPLSYAVPPGADIAALDCRFPVILKPTVHDEVNVFTMAKAWRADNRAQLVARYNEAAALVGRQNIVIQELIPGSGERQFSYAAVCNRGVSVAALVARRTRQYPIDFGYTSTFVECVEAPEVERAARRVLEAIGISGLVEVEFKFDVRDGLYKILDINARAWTWIGLGAAAGVDFPWIAWQVAHDLPILFTSPRIGTAWMHAPRDIVAALQEIVAGRGSLRGYLRSLRRSLTFAAFAADDPVPALFEMPLVVLRVLRRRVLARLKFFINPNPMEKSVG